jgi:hypothetical protein
VAVSSLTCINAPSARRQHRVQCNRRADYLARIATAAGDSRLRIAHAADAVRAAGKDLPPEAADRVVAALLSLAGLSDDVTLNEAAGRLLELAGSAEGGRNR